MFSKLIQNYYHQQDHCQYDQQYHQQVPDYMENVSNDHQITRSHSIPSFYNLISSQDTVSADYWPIRAEPDLKRRKNYVPPIDNQLIMSRRLNSKQKYLMMRLYTDRNEVDWNEVTREFNRIRWTQVPWQEVDVVNSFELIIDGTALPECKGAQARADIEYFWDRIKLFTSTETSFLSVRRLSNYQLTLLYNIFCSSEGFIDWKDLVMKFNQKLKQQTLWNVIDVVATYETLAIGAYLPNCNECRILARKKLSKFSRFSADRRTRG